MFSRTGLSLLLIVSAFVVVSAQPQLKNPTQEGEQKKRDELRKKIKETLDSASSEVSAVKSPETRTFLLVQIVCLLWSYDEKGARSLLDDAQGLTASMINDPKIKSPTWADRMGLRSEFVSMIARRDPQAALEFLRRTKFVILQVSPQSDRASGALWFDTQMEQKLASQVAKKDPKRALEMAEESMERGNFSELNELINVVFEKDKEAGKKLVGVAFGKLKSGDLSGRSDGLRFAPRFLEEEYASRRAESVAGKTIAGNKKRQPVLDDQALREWNNFVIQATLAMIQREGLFFRGSIHPSLSTLMRLLPEIEKLSPALVANFKRVYGQLIQKLDTESRYQIETANVKAEEILASAIKAQDGMRKEYLKRAIETALDPDGNFELARKIVEEHVTDPDDQKEMTEQIEEKLKAYTFESGKIEDATASLISLESDAERAYRLADLAGRAMKNGNKKLAAELLEKALGYLPQPVETKDEYEAMIRIIYNSIDIDRERSFETFGSLIEPINQLVNATIQYKRYEGKRSDHVRDEIPLRELRRDFPAKGFTDVIVPLSKADFDRTIGLAERIRQPELRLHIKLLAVREAASE